MAPFLYRLLSAMSVVLGITSLIAFFLFVLLGSLKIIQLAMTNMESLVFDSILSMVFFVQHSTMVRESIKAKIIKLIPHESFHAVHSIISGATLLGVTIFWQESPLVVMTVGKPYSYLFVFSQILAIIGLIWAVKSLKGFDPFGRKQISKHLKKQKDKQEENFVYKGPYNFVRHPFYFCILVMMWAYPVFSADRLLFLCLWTVWIILGTILEEKDLLKQIGGEYRQYQMKVPMLIPYKIWDQLIK